MILEALQLTLNNALGGSTALEAEIQNYPELLKVIERILFLRFVHASSCEQNESSEFVTSTSLLPSLLTSTSLILIHPFSFPQFPRLRASLDGRPLSSMQP
jgi:hypothetical protein